MTACLVRSVLLLMCMAGPALSAESDPDAKTVPLTREQISTYLEAGRGLLQKGLPAEAIRQYFDPVIQSFAQLNHDPDVQVYAAHSMVDSLMYAAMAATADNKGKSTGKHKSIVLDGAWTDALEMKAYALTELGRLDESEALYKRCLAMNPDDAMARHELDYFAHLRSNQATSPSSPH